MTTIAPRQGSLALLIESYGQAAPAANGVTTLSVPQPGQVVAVAVVAGARVAAGQPIASFTVSPTARSGYVQAADALRAAQKQRRTTQTLLGQQLATNDQLVQADRAVTDAQAALDALRQEGAGAGTVTLRAPHAGIVATVPVAPGDRTQPGQALATIARTGAMIVTVGIDPARRGELRAGEPVRLSRLDGTAPPVAGRIVRVDAVLNPRTRQVDVDIGYPAGALLSGEAVRVGIESGRASGWIVPHRAVVIDADGKALVYQAVRGKARSVSVAVRASEGDQDCVAGPLDARAPVIVDGAFQLSAGDAIRTGPAT
ncbi:efflux RND transporter periplasmic adaptor subunit [uncultured Sphingomonas sp.]|uniref:efflux RND transporter periplasmic adaptor subunit n=1 Tax=uncultured Sphingomonas sp. TaxID=158754 RepID=UPI0035CBC9B6